MEGHRRADEQNLMKLRRGFCAGRYPVAQSSGFRVNFDLFPMRHDLVLVVQMIVVPPDARFGGQESP